MKILNYLLIISIMLFSCKGKDESTKENKFDKGTPAVCISDGVPVNEAPAKGSKYLTSLNLGETMIYLGVTKADSADPKKEYYKVELTDGSVAWARSYGIVIGATPATITSETPVYKRPDLVNKTDKVLNAMEFVVIMSEKDDWAEITAANKKKSGWVKKQYLSTNQEDVAVSTLAAKSILDADGKVVAEKVPDFVAKLPYTNSSFQGYLQQIVDEQVGSAVEASVEEYQDSYYEGEEN